MFTADQMEDTIANAAFFVSRQTDIGFDNAWVMCRECAGNATTDGIEFNAHMLAEVVMDMQAI